MSVTFPRPYTVIVAGAGSGIGQAAARRLSGAGVHVIALDRDRSALRKLSGSAPEGTVTIRMVDAEDAAALRETVGAVAAGTGTVHGLLNTIGINPDAGTPSTEVDIGVFDRVVRVNLTAALVMTQAVLPAMLTEGYGRIVHVSSIAGKEGNPRMVSYSATKAGLIGMVKALGREYADTGVLINAVAPAVIRTPLVENTAPEVVTQMLSRIPMGRAGTLQESSELLAWMLSPACGFTTGFTFDLSGGRATY